jgi:archaellum biogenesis ATPase FlaH
MGINEKYKTIKDWAVAYRTQGMNVIPLYDYSKNPQTTQVNIGGLWVSGWKDLQTRHATDQEFSQGFDEQSPTGLGVVTGKISGIVVVDVDSYKTGGMHFHLDSPLKAKTARGGMHYFFKYVEPIKTTGLKDGVFIEIKSDGGFIVLSPSEVWIDEEKTRKGKYQWEVAKKRLEDLPPIHQSDLEAYTRSQTAFRDFHSLVKSPLGEQHNNLRTIANKVFARFKQSEWDIAEEVVRSLANEFVPPHPPERVDKMILDCREYILRNKTDKPYIEPRSIAQVAVSRMEEKELEKKAPSTGYPELDKLIRGFVPGHLYTMTGDTNVGKSSIAANFAIRVSQQKHHVLYYALEPENTIVDYMASVRCDKRFDELTESDVSTDDSFVHIYGKQEISTLQDLLVSIRESSVTYGLVIIDHIGYFIHNTTGGVLQEQSNTVKELAWLAKEKRIAIMLIAHLRKRGMGKKKDATPTADDISGSASFKQDSTEVMIVVRPSDEADAEGTKLSDVGKMYVTKTKTGPNGSFPLLFSSSSANVVTPGLVASKFGGH